jgi:hypothetical protein
MIGVAKAKTVPEEHFFRGCLLSLRRLLEPWAAARNAAQKGVDWQFTADDDQLAAAQTALRAEG